MAKTVGSSGSTKTEQVAIRMEKSLVQRLDGLAWMMRAKRPGINVSRADVIRALLMRALDLPETEAVETSAGDE